MHVLAKSLVPCITCRILSFKASLHVRQVLLRSCISRRPPEQLQTDGHHHSRDTSTNPHSPWRNYSSCPNPILDQQLTHSLDFVAALPCVVVARQAFSFMQCQLHSQKINEQPGRTTAADKASEVCRERTIPLICQSLRGQLSRCSE